MRRVEREDLDALASGCALLGSAGGGITTYLALMAREAPWPIDLHTIDDLDPATPCIAPAFAGATMVLGERLPGDAPFAPLIAAIERWLGITVPAVCALEVGGLNGITPFVAAPGKTVVDADCMGRAMPSFDQVSLLVDRVPGLVVATGTGGGVALVESERPADAETVARTALALAGGTGVVVVGGFTVGDLREHAVPGAISTALDLGRSLIDAIDEPIDELARSLGGRLLAHGRVQSAQPDARDELVQAYEIEGRGGEVHRLVARSEALALLTDGELVSAAPSIIAVLDARSRTVLEVPQISPGRYVSIVELPAPEWWLRSDERMRHVMPSVYGLRELDPR